MIVWAHVKAKINAVVMRKIEKKAPGKWRGVCVCVVVGSKSKTNQANNKSEQTVWGEGVVRKFQNVRKRN
jgi:hypothetical protein